MYGGWWDRENMNHGKILQSVYNEDEKYRDMLHFIWIENAKEVTKMNTVKQKQELKPWNCVSL